MIGYLKLTLVLELPSESTVLLPLVPSYFSQMLTLRIALKFFLDIIGGYRGIPVLVSYQLISRLF